MEGLAVMDPNFLANFSVWAWHEDLVFDCDTCGERIEITEGPRSLLELYNQAREHWIEAKHHVGK